MSQHAYRDSPTYAPYDVFSLFQTKMLNEGRTFPVHTNQTKEYDGVAMSYSQTMVFWPRLIVAR